MIPRNEHPNPQFMRESWLCLNGEWDFEIDNGKSGRDRKLYGEDAVLHSKITVPFCPQSKLSGVEHKDFLFGVWYSRRFTLNRAQTDGNVFLHFGAVDYKAFIYINEVLVCTHEGGYSSFTADITAHVREGENTVTVYAEDDERDPMIPKGKQCSCYYSQGCSYTRTTGIWQSVWLEFTPKAYIKSLRLYPDIHKPGVTLQAQLCGKADFSAEVFYDGRKVGQASFDASSGSVYTEIEVSEKHLWEVGCGRLYTLHLRFGNDRVESYFGLRQISIDGCKVRINGKSVFQRLILDQGFYPDGIYTAPTDEELENDIKRSLSCGYNGARLHEKVFEPRFLYHADRLGYIVWGEYPNWGLDHTDPMAIYHSLPEWLEIVNRDFNHPSVVGWCPFNETWNINGREQFDPMFKLFYTATKSIDTTRPFIDSSACCHVATDIYDVHDYCQDPGEFKEHYEALKTGGTVTGHRNSNGKTNPYRDGPFFVSEFGGIGWIMEESENAWGYGESPKSENDFINRYKGLCDALLDNEKIFAFCYTQLTDVEQEQNGLFTYDRRAKFDTKKLHEITSRKAAIED